MLKTSPLARVAVLTGVVSVLACGQIPFSIPESEPSTLHITPSGIAIEPGANVQLSVFVEEGSDRGVASANVAWSSSAPNTAAVTSNGVVIGLAAGRAEITARFDGHAAISTISVVGSSPSCVASQQVPIQCPVLSR